MTYLVRATALTNYVRVAREVGLDPYKQLSKAGIRRATLLDPDAMIAADALRSLLAESASAAGVEDFGLRMAETRQLTDLGPLGFAIQGEPTLRKALESMMRYLRLQSESVVMAIEELDELVVIRESLLTDGQAPQRQSIELVVAGVYRLLRRFLGETWKPRSICFSHAPPSGPTGHARVFGMPVLFNQEFDGIVCRATDLDAPLAAYDPLMAWEVRQHLDTLLAGSDLAFPDVVRRLVLALLPSGNCSVDSVAQHLRVDRRTVHRRLAKDGESYSGIYNGVRADLAARLARSEARPLAELAALLGFSTASSFARWFGGHFGCTVSEWRARHRARLTTPTSLDQPESPR
ncbi:AraC family transcriptional regulator [Cupriavidus basilensis OR16]|uniref:AraC family transcriptional regulator n=1 Tax=Cupriavidus basilensis OR16 TaxID=1127483 RepID=H1SA66_9BURK|nr:AraC family transcriptional regulator [Cupriavidus basilensis]EHP40615.1 AraC family transcriptional regulator [Cupriavidus basilensis OR16]